MNTPPDEEGTTYEDIVNFVPTREKPMLIIEGVRAVIVPSTAGGIPPAAEEWAKIFCTEE